MPDEALTILSFLSPNNHVLLLPPLLETRICIVFSFLCVNKHYKKYKKKHFLLSIVPILKLAFKNILVSKAGQ
jgi:hypothetical protein